jgi:hypothetical protein
MLPINHSQTSQGLPSSLWVGVGEVKTSGGDEPGFYVGVERTSSHEDQHFTPNGCRSVRTPDRRTLVGPLLRCALS